MLLESLIGLVFIRECGCLLVLLAIEGCLRSSVLSFTLAVAAFQESYGQIQAGYDFHTSNLLGKD